VDASNGSGNPKFIAHEFVQDYGALGERDVEGNKG